MSDKGEQQEGGARGEPARVQGEKPQSVDRSHTTKDFVEEKCLAAEFEAGWPHQLHDPPSPCLNRELQISR